MSLSRRKFLVGCSTAVAAMSGGRIGQMVFAGERSQAQLAGTNEILVVLFCRGGWDALSLVSPFDDAIYNEKRSSLALEKPITIDPSNSSFTSSIGLHPQAAPLAELYQQNSMAIVHACGLNNDTRSHFEAMDYIERGTPGNKSTASGWLTRHLQLVGEEGIVPSMSSGAAIPASLMANPNALSLKSLESYGLSSAWRYNHDENQALFEALKRGYTGDGAFASTGRRTIETIESIQQLKNQNEDDFDYVPKPNLKYPYPSDGAGRDLSGALQTIAHTIKLDLGLRVATVDFGGWDTHEGQGTNGGYFAGLVDGLSRNLHAFYNDLSDYWDRLTVVVMSEFGRRLGENTSGGTDHGHGNIMLTFGGNVNGGKIYGAWPGLEDLDQDQDLKITTDFRTILGEVVSKRLGNPELGKVFPGLTQETYQPLGLVKGNPGTIIF